MKTRTVLFRLIILSGLLLLISCSKNNYKTNEHIINAIIQPDIVISSGDTLKVNLGTFGDEEGAGIFKNPRNAIVSKIYRQSNSTSIIYEYFPNDNFIGKDTAALILYRGSDGAHPGMSDTSKICITVKH
jgi:hypothetical protein